LTVYASRSRAGFVSHRRRSWDSPFGAFSSRKESQPFPDEKDPPTVPPVGIPCTEVWGRLDEPQFLGLSFRESLATEVCLAHRPLDAPLGFSLLGYLSECLGRDFARPPPSRFARRTMRPASRATESRSALARPKPSQRQAADVGSGNPFRVFAPAATTTFERPSPGLCVHLASRCALLSTARRS
jgi:hypothetical protein